MAHVLSAHADLFLHWFGHYRKNRWLISCGIGALVLRIIYGYYQRHNVKRILADKHSQLKADIELVRAELMQSITPSTEDELLSLTTLNLAELRLKLESGDVTPQTLLHAFQLKVLRLYDQGNSGVCQFIREAADIFNATLGSNTSLNKSDRSPLHGIPISIKETCCVAGYDSTAGCIKYCNKPNSEDSVVVEVLRKSGAIPFVLTSTSQLCRSLDGFNPIFGDITNPFNSKRITGGSSSGEAVLLAQNGSPVGIGSDIGGSLRIPCGFCGLACLKPTVNRLSVRGTCDINDQSVLELCASIGPMGRRVDDIADVMRTLLKPPLLFELDPSVPPIPFDEDAYNGPQSFSPLVIGYFDTIADNSIMQTVSGVKNAISATVDLLRRAGHEVIKFKVPDPKLANTLFLRCILADGGKQFRSNLAYEPVGPQLRFINMFTRFPMWLGRFSDFILPHVGYGPLAFTHTIGGLRDLKEVMNLRLAVREYRERFRRAWHKTGNLDALICPISAFPAPPTTTNPMYITPSIFYTALFNLLDYPAGTVPVGWVDEADVLEARKQSIRSWLNGEKHCAHVHAIQHDSCDLPMGVQVVSLPYHEESVLRVMRIIEQCVCDSGRPQDASGDQPSSSS